MIATCPACGKRYRLADEAVPAEGRAVRCATCGNGWIATREPGGTSPPASVSAVDGGRVNALERSAIDAGGIAASKRSAPTRASGSVAPNSATNHTASPDPDARGARTRSRDVAVDPVDFPRSTVTTDPIRASYPAASGPCAGSESIASALTGFADPDADLADVTGSVARPRRRWPAAVAVVAVVALGSAAAVLLLAPQVLPFDTARLGLPVVALPRVELPDLALPAFDLPRFDLAALPRVTISFPPLDLTRVPYVGADLDRWIDPPPVPPSPLRIDVTAERRRLANGTRLLVVSGAVANPTAASHSVPPIEATLADAGGRVALRWRIAVPVARLDPGRTASFESVAANYPAGSPRLKLAFAPE